MNELSIPHRSAARSATKSGVRGVLEGLRILIVDDDPDARDLLYAILSQRLADVSVASCAAEAFEMLQRERPDVLVSDIAMPHEDGYTLIGRIRRLDADEGGATPAIAVTAYAGRSDEDRAKQAGFDAHFSKPVDVDALVRLLVDVRNAER